MTPEAPLIPMTRRRPVTRGGVVMLGLPAATWRDLMEPAERCRDGEKLHEQRPMNGNVDSLDHIGIAVPDLAAAAASYQRLGFQLTPLQQQSGPLEPGGPVVRWGSANRCAMLEQGYLEL